MNWQAVGNGMTPLHAASFNANEEILKLLIEHKADLNITTNRGQTSLILAAIRNQMATVRTLVEAGADISIRGCGNKTAAERAEEMGYHTIVEYLNTKAAEMRFHASARNDRGQLHRYKGRSLRAIQRDLKENGVFVNHMLLRLKHLCADHPHKAST